MYIVEFNAAALRYIFLSLILILGLCLEISSSYAKVFRGDVTRIADGDTISVLLEDDTNIKVRLAGIDTPELDQPYGLEARDQLVQLVLGQPITCVCTKKDRYERWVCRVSFEDIDVNWMLVRDGFAWWYRYYQKEQPEEDRMRYEDAEMKAKDERIGLWSDESPVPPWEWRRQRREKQNRQ